MTDDALECVRAWERVGALGDACQALQPTLAGRPTKAYRTVLALYRAEQDRAGAIWRALSEAERLTLDAWQGRRYRALHARRAAGGAP